MFFCYIAFCRTYYHHNTVLMEGSFELYSMQFLALYNLHIMPDIHSFLKKSTGSQMHEERMSSMISTILSNQPSTGKDFWWSTHSICNRCLFSRVTTPCSQFLLSFLATNVPAKHSRWYPFCWAISTISRPLTETNHFEWSIRSKYVRCSFSRATSPNTRRPSSCWPWVFWDLTMPLIDYHGLFLLSEPSIGRIHSQVSMRL